MKKYALAIAGQKAVQDLHDFFRYWGDKGLSTSQPTSRNGSQPLQQMQALPLPPEFTRFYHVYNQVKTAETAASFQAIMYRCRMVELFKLYRTAEAVPLADEPVYHVGQTRRARRKRSLFHFLHPGFEEVEDPATNRASKRDWYDFTKRLSAATRWQIISEALRYGAGTDPREHRLEQLGPARHNRSPVCGLGPGDLAL
jgi:hypothetical protein